MGAPGPDRAARTARVALVALLLAAPALAIFGLRSGDPGRDLVLLGLMYLLLGFTWWMTRRRVLRTMAARMESTAALAGRVAHDMNNLMAGIMANTQVLQGDVAGRPEAQETLATIVDSAERGGQLAQQLLDVARTEGPRP